MSKFSFSTVAVDSIAPLHYIMEGLKTWNADSSTRINIYKGAFPDGTDVNTAIRPRDYRASDQLCKFNPYGSTELSNQGLDADQFVWQMTTDTQKYSTITADGTAMWFLWAKRDDQLMNSTYGVFFGTVGLQGSGADMIVTNTNFVTGQVASVLEIRVNIAWKFGY